MEFARENPRLYVNAVEPGFTPGTALGRESHAMVRFLLKHVPTRLAPFIKYWSTPQQAARVITKILINDAGQTRVYYDEEGVPMLPSAPVRNPEFTARVVTETRALLPITSALPRTWHD